MYSAEDGLGQYPEKKPAASLKRRYWSFPSSSPVSKAFVTLIEKFAGTGQGSGKRAQLLGAPVSGFAKAIFFLAGGTLFVMISFFTDWHWMTSLSFWWLVTLGIILLVLAFGILMAVVFGIITLGGTTGSQVWFSAMTPKLADIKSQVELSDVDDYIQNTHFVS